MRQKKLNKSIRTLLFFLMLQLLLIYKPKSNNQIYSKARVEEYNLGADINLHKSSGSVKSDGKMKSALGVIKDSDEVNKTPSVASITIEKQVLIHDGNEVVEIIKKAARDYGLNEADLVAISYCESGFRRDAVNGDYQGIFQFSTSTWMSNRKAMGLDPNPILRNNPEEAARTAAFKMSRDGYGAWPACSAELLASK